MTGCNRGLRVALAVLTPGLALAEGTPGQITKFGDDGTTSVDSVASEDAAGNIGIGTTTPQAKLDVNGAIAGTQYNIGNRRVLSIAGTNTFVGGHAGESSPVDNFNSFFGWNAGFASRMGMANSFFGTEAGAFNNGDANAFFGAFAGSQNTRGAGNSFFGARTGSSNTSGFANSFFGSSAGFFNEEGSSNSFFGLGSGTCNQRGEHNSFFGFWSGVNSTGSGNSFFGDNAGAWNGPENNNSFFGNRAGYTSTGSGNTFVGAGANGAARVNNATVIGANAVVDASNKIRLGNTDVTVIEGQVAFTYPSDMTKKENFRPVDGEDVLKKIRALRLTSWNLIGHDPKQFRHYGPLAQEFFAAFGDDGIGTIGTPTTINSGDIAGILMIAVQTLEKRAAELGQQKDLLKQTVDSVKAENSELKARLERLERIVGG